MNNLNFGKRELAKQSLQINCALSNYTTSTKTSYVTWAKIGLYGHQSSLGFSSMMKALWHNFALSLLILKMLATTDDGFRHL